MTGYVCGFMFDPYLEEVVLIRKERPAWQKGRLNGVGGHIEAGETPLEAIEREFQEETEFYTTNDLAWHNFCTLAGRDWRCWFFWAVSNEEAAYVGSRTDEKVLLWKVDDYEQMMPNLRWLIPMAVNQILGRDQAECFNIQETTLADLDLILLGVPHDGCLPLPC